MRAPEWLRKSLAAVTRADGRRLAPWGLVLVALCLRLFRLSFQPLWWDEGWSLYFASSDARTILELTAVDIHPPFYYLLLHLWTELLGSSLCSVRLFSVLIGTVTVPLLFATGRKLLGDRGGLVAMLLLAISPFHIYYSQEVRMYGLVTLLGLAAFFFALQWDAGSQGVGTWVGYVVAAATALYTQYFAAFLVLLFLPWLWYAGGKLWTYVRFKVSVEQDPSLGLFTYLNRHLAAFTWGHTEGALAAWWWVGLLPLAFLALAIALALWRHSRAQGIRDSSSLLSAILLHPSVIVLAVTLTGGYMVNLLFPFNPPRSERLLLLALPAYLILVAAGLRVLRRERQAWAVVSATFFVVAAVTSLSFYYTVPRYPDDDYRPVADRVKALGLSSDAVLAVHPWQVGYFYAYIPDDEVRPTLVLTPREVIPRERQLWADEPARMAGELESLLAQHGRLWLLDHRAMGRVLEKQIEAYLVEHAYPRLSDWDGENTVLSTFAAGEPVAQPVTARFGEWLILEGAALSSGPLEAGWDSVAIDLTWNVPEPPTEDYTVGLRLVGPTGHVWAQRDTLPRGGLESFSAWPASEAQLDHHGLLVPAGTPPGRYDITLQVYRSDDIAVLPVTFEGGSGGEVTLGAVRVVQPQSPPPIEALAFQQPLRVDFGDRLRLLGFTLELDSTYLPGETVPVELVWETLTDPGEDLLPHLQLLSSEGQVLADLAEKPVAGTYPTAWWQAGEFVRDPHGLSIPATVPAGRYRLALGLIRAVDGLPVEARPGQSAVDLGEIEVGGREHRYQPTAPQHDQVASFGTSAEMTGYDLQEAVHAPGTPLQVTIHWHALETPDRNYHTFVHLLDADGAIIAQHDGLPAGGKMPTLGWLPGEYVTDTHRLQLPSDLPGGQYRLGVGFYDPVTGLRLGERVILELPVLVSNDE
jgi:hypothetical protein